MPRSSPTVDSAADPPAVSLSPEQSGDRGNSFGLALASIDFLPRFLRLATINVLSNLMVPLSGLISVAFLGHLNDIRYLTGVMLATVLFNTIYRTLSFLRMSTTGMTAQAVGRDDRSAMLLTGMRNGLLAMGLGGLILLLQHPLRDIGFRLLNAAPEVGAAGQAYYDARIWAAPVTLLNFVIIGWLLGQEKGEAKQFPFWRNRVLLLSIVGNGVNILLDYWLIVRWGWQSAGAGWATAIGQLAMAIVGLVMVGRSVKWQEIRSLAPEIFNWKEFRQTLTLNSNLLIRTFTLLCAFLLFASLSSALGTTVLAENALLLQIVTLTAYFVDGFAYATESLAGMFHGEGRRDRLLPLATLAGCVSFVFALAIALICICFPHSVFHLFTNSAAVLAGIHEFVVWLLPVLGCGSIAFMLDGYFAGLTAGATLRNTALIATLLGFVPVAIIAWNARSSTLLWLAMALFMAIRAGLLAVRVPATTRLES
ncbi:MATE family efflux transporter [Leptolyngbya sp. GB1-A1]|uniref:guanitoxin biosynthesis MATE family efflux transporter GntT n=2 Tax=unclassified Leptolyngbya TaxID=2650499 RepID=UPI003297C9BD